ncbi:type II secretion system F family protein [Halobacillus litoralis]|uniref:type II secretion system F family protein n=1 Tax=Halobacillus litoralis TaxID=45668 RepID=UPI001CFC6FF6|nr:type II secretion system F family protein [Halobacillus litoralis]
MHLVSYLKKKFLRSKDPPLPIDHQIIFLHRLSHILKKGYPLVEALQMTGWDHRLKAKADDMILTLKLGEPFSTACERARFSSTVTTFLYFSNFQDNLAEIIHQCRELLQMKKDQKEKLFKVIRYPFLLFIFLIAAFIIMKKTVIPNFLLLFEGEDNKALWLMIVINYMMNISGIVVILFIIAATSFKFILPRLSIQKKLSLYERFPPLKTYHSFNVSFLFTTHLYSLLQAGLTLKQAMELIQGHHQHEILAHYSQRIVLDLSEGKTTASAIHSCSLFRNELTDIFHHTNDMKALQDELEMLSEFFMEYMQEKINSWLQMIQPVFFIGIAIVIVSIYASIMLPLYHWMNQM